jgi:hypothetical protein
MTANTLPTQSDAETTAYEMAIKLPDNILDLWSRFLLSLRRETNRPELQQRLDGMLATFNVIRRFPLPAADLDIPMTQAECTRLAMQPNTLLIESHLRLRALLYAFETDGPDTTPLRLQWFLQAQRHRATNILNAHPMPSSSTSSTAQIPHEQQE